MCVILARVCCGSGAVCLVLVYMCCFRVQVLVLAVWTAYDAELMTHKMMPSEWKMCVVYF